MCKCMSAQHRQRTAGQPGSVIPTVSSFPRTSPTTWAEAALNGTKGVVKMAEGRRLGSSKAVHAFTASVLTDLWSELR